MEWLNDPKEPIPRDYCPVYICGVREDDNNQGPCLLDVCVTKFCFGKY